MKKIETGIDGLYILEPNVWEDGRGYFFESYSKEKLDSLGLKYDFIQDNESKSSFGVLRGLHLQKDEHSQAKLVKVTKGEVLDVALDLRPKSKTYGKWYSIVLNEKNKKQLLIPRGFAHGFLVLSQDAVFNYKVDNLYNKDSEVSIDPFDENININWGLKKEDLILSEKDKNGLKINNWRDI
ncbi:MAG: dTDP-4-dehydrorhamnose 3,5-epimerase [Patescibacteria group bacterium]